MSDEDTVLLRYLSRFRNYLVSYISDLKCKAICVLNQIFLEYQSVFSDILGETSKEPLSHFQTTDDFENIHAEKLEKVLENITSKNFARNKIPVISELTANSFVLKFCCNNFSL